MTFGDFGAVGSDIPVEIQRRYNSNRIAILEKENVETCLDIAEIYEQLGNKFQSEKYFEKAVRYEDRSKARVGKNI